VGCRRHHCLQSLTRPGIVGNNSLALRVSHYIGATLFVERRIKVALSQRVVPPGNCGGFTFRTGSMEVGLKESFG